MVDPLERVSEHFLLLDFLGNQTVYTKGLENAMIRDKDFLTKWDNLRTLATEVLEPILRKWGPLSISYGYISPALSRQIVKYQDPNKPSHHRFDLGAAADICVHNWVNNENAILDDMPLGPNTAGAPIILAHDIDQMGLQYSRLITYSESPYICIAASTAEVYQNKPRKAFYENRYQGQKGEKPEYIQLSNQGARNRHFAQLQEQGLEHGWQGGGYPSYHGGGYRQYHHMRVSQYTMVSDWLLDLQSIASGGKNIPALNDERVQDAFAAAGIVYDFIARLFKRVSIIAGYVSPQNPSFDPSNDWRTPKISFVFMPPASVPQNAVQQMLVQLPDGAYAEEVPHGLMQVNIDVNMVLETPEWDL